MKILSLNILDIVQNSIRAKADKISIEITESVKNDLYRIVVTDNGTRIPVDIHENITDISEATRTKRKMGSGLPLLKYYTEMTGGNLIIESIEGKGTQVKATFSFSHKDRQLLGDIAGIVIILISVNPDIDFIYRHFTDKGNYRFSTKETKEYLGLNTLNSRSLLEDLGSMIGENLKEIEASGFVFRQSLKEVF
jgi:hypothetical protein